MEQHDELCSCETVSETPVAFDWLPEIAARVASFLHHNVVACTLRRLNKANAETFRDFRTVQLSQPAPSEAFAEHWLSPDACKSLTLLQRRELVCLVAASGDAANLKVAIDASGCTLDVSALDAAAAAGSIDCCELLLKLRHGSLVKRKHVLGIAATAGHRAVCDWCLANGAKRSWAAVAAAYSGGHTELADFLRPAEEAFDEEKKRWMVSAAAGGCSLELLKSMWVDWGEELQMQSGRSSALSRAVGSPTPDWEAKTEFLLAQGFAFDSHSADHALRLPPDAALSRLEWLRTRGCALAQLYPLSPLGDLAAAHRAVNFGAVEWLLTHGVPLTSLVEYWSRGSAVLLDVAQSLVKAGRITLTQIVKRALQAGDQGIVTLRWLVAEYGREQVLGELRGTEGLVAAAEAGCVEAMALLSVQGRGCTSEAWTHAARSGCEAALEWLDQRGCPKPDDGRPYIKAAEKSDARTIRVLRRLGLPWGPRLAYNNLFGAAVYRGVGIDTLRWMVAEGCPVDWAAAKAAAEERRRDSDDPCTAEVLAWIEEEMRVQGAPAAEEQG